MNEKYELALAAIVDHGVTLEEQILNLCSEKSHIPLRNANLPRGVSINILRLLTVRDFIFSRPIPRDDSGSIVEYRLRPKGEARLRELCATRKSLATT